MNEKSRLFNTIRNSAVGMLVQGSSILLNFLVRLVFVRYLSQEYLGVNGLFTNVLTVLSLAELGVGNAIIYSLYKPVAEKSEREIAALLYFYKKIYRIIGCVVISLGILLVPLIPYLIKNTNDIPDVTFIYLLFLANTSFSYFFAYKRSIFSADQRESVISENRLCFNIVRAILQCVVLITTKNFILYLLVQIACTFGENLFISVRADKAYPFIKKYKKERILKEKVLEIKQNVKSLMIYKVGSTVLDGTDNIILSATSGVASVGVLSNYTLIVNSVNQVLSQVMHSMTSSVGNFIAKESEKRYEELLNNITFVSFVFFGATFVCLNCLMNPFISLAFGEQYVLGHAEVFVISLNFYIYGMMNSIWTFRSTMGLFVYGKFRPLVSAVINVVVSIILANHIGMLGILLGTTITRITTNVWFDPYIVFKHGLHKSAKQYYISWVKYLIIALIAILFVNLSFGVLREINCDYFVVQCLVCLMGVCGVFWVLLCRKKEYANIKHMLFERIGSKSVRK